MSCTRAREFLDAGKIEIVTEVDARKEKIDDKQAWEQLQGAETVFVAKGKKIISYPPADEYREELITAIMGRSGNLRAPTLKIGKISIVGFNDEMYRELITA